MADFPLISFDMANPVLEGVKKVKELEQLGLNNEGIGLQNIMRGLLNQNQTVVNQYQPQSMEEALRAAKLKNALSNIELQYAPQMSQSELALRSAQARNALANAKSTEFLTQNPLLNLPGAAGQLGAYQYLIQHPELSRGLNDAGVSRETAPVNVQQAPTAGPVGPLFGGPPANMSIWDRSGNQAPPVNNAPVNQNLFGMPQQAATVQTMGNIGAQLGPANQNDVAELLKKSIFTNLQRQIANTELTQQKAQNYSFNSLPIDQKRNILAAAGGMGIGPQEAQQRYANGESIADMAKANGFDPNNLPEPIYPATNTDITRIHNRQQAFAELNTMMPIVEEALAPYAQRFEGYSPKQILDSLSKDEKDQDRVIRFLAARMLVPELSSIRLKAMSGQVGIEAIREVTAAAISNFKILEPGLTPEQFRKLNKYANEWVNAGVKASNAVGLDTSRAQNKAIGSSASAVNENAFIDRKSINGKSYIKKSDGHWYEE